MRGYPVVALGSFLSAARDEVVVEPRATYRTAGIYSFGRGLFERPPLSGAETTYRTFFRLREGQFVYSRLFAWEGALAVVPSNFNGWFVSQEFPTFDIDTGQADAGFVAWLSRWPHVWDALAGTTKGLGLRRKRVHPQQLLSVAVPLPPLDEQRRLVRLLNSISDLAGVVDAARAEVGALVPAALNHALLERERERESSARSVPDTSGR